MNWIRANVPFPIFLACFGAPFFGLFEFFFKMFFGRPAMANIGLFIEDRSLAFLAAALMGAALLFIFGWYVNHKAGLRVSATTNDLSATQPTHT